LEEKGLKDKQVRQLQAKQQFSENQTELWLKQKQKPISLQYMERATMNQQKGETTDN
jgi:hypothetical protein